MALEAQELAKEPRNREVLERAVEKYELALKIFRQVGYDLGAGWVSDRLGHVYLKLGELHKAVESYEKSLEIARKIQDLNSEQGVLRNLGDVYKDRGPYEKAVEYVRQGS